MAVAADLINDLLVRVRDPDGAATSRADVRDLLDRAQLLVVRHTGTLIHERTLAAPSNTLIFTLNPADTLRVVDIYSGNKRLSLVRWPNLFHAEGPAWWRNTAATGPETWAPLGTRHFFIHPAWDADGNNLTIREQRRPGQLLDEDSPIELPSEHHPLMLDLVETLLYLRHRDDSVNNMFAKIDRR